MCEPTVSVLHDELAIPRTDGGASPMHADNLVIMDGATLSCAEVAAVGGLAFYGRTTGVGANGGVTVAPGSGHGLRLLRSHAGGAGEQVSAGIARGALAIRLNQLAAGGSGAAPAWLEAVAGALSDGLVPECRVLGGIGTGDLTGLAAAALALIGE